MDGSQQEIVRQLLRFETQLVRLEKRIDFIYSVVSVAVAIVIIVLGGGILLKFLGGLAFSDRLYLVFPAAVLGLFAISMLINRKLGR